MDDRFRFRILVDRRLVLEVFDVLDSKRVGETVLAMVEVTNQNVDEERLVHR